MYSLRKSALTFALLIACDGGSGFGGGPSFSGLGGFGPGASGGGGEGGGGGNNDGGSGDDGEGSPEIAPPPGGEGKVPPGPGITYAPPHRGAPHARMSGGNR